MSAIELPVITHAQALASDASVMINIWTKNGIPPSWLKRNFLGWSYAWIDDQGKRNPLRSWVRFEGQENGKWQDQPQDKGPIQGSAWFHFDPRNQATAYQIAPVFGDWNNPQVDLSLAIVTNKVSVESDCGGGIRFASNFGIPATQWVYTRVAQGADGKPSKGDLRKKVGTPGDPTRIRMAGNILKDLKTFLGRWASYRFGVYEFTDEEIVDITISKGKKVSGVLSEAGKDDAENAPTRKKFHGTIKQCIDRFVPTGHIAHNKFFIGYDKNGVAQEIWTGSTNLTPTGIAGQSNNGLTLTNKDVAKLYDQYLDALIEDSQKNDSKQGPKLRAFCHRPYTFTLSDGTQLVIFFSPNTKSQDRNGKSPIDLAFVQDLLKDVEQSAFFGCFLPGTPSIIDFILAALAKNPNLVVRGVVSNPHAMPANAVQLYHRFGEVPPIVLASAFSGDFGDFHKELLSLGFAITHFKVAVFDMLGKRPVVITGSHNFGVKASTVNDENLNIFIGNRAYAIKMGVYILSVYRHYRERWIMSQLKTPFSGFLTKDSSWVDSADWTPGTAKCREKALFAGALDVLDDPAYTVKLGSNNGDNAPPKKPPTKKPPKKPKKPTKKPPKKPKKSAVARVESRRRRT